MLKSKGPDEACILKASHPEVAEGGSLIKANTVSAQSHPSGTVCKRSICPVTVAKGNMSLGLRRFGRQQYFLYTLVIVKPQL